MDVSLAVLVVTLVLTCPFYCVLKPRLLFIVAARVLYQRIRLDGPEHAVASARCWGGG